MVFFIIQLMIINCVNYCFGMNRHSGPSSAQSSFLETEQASKQTLFPGYMTIESVQSHINELIDMQNNHKIVIEELRKRLSSLEFQVKNFTAKGSDLEQGPDNIVPTNYTLPKQLSSSIKIVSASTSGATLGWFCNNAFNFGSIIGCNNKKGEKLPRFIISPAFFETFVIPGLLCFATIALMYNVSS